VQAKNIRIVQIDTFEGFREHASLQNLVWGYDPPEAVPLHLMIALSRNGGLVLGAYADNQMVGLLLGVPALRHGQLMHLSHLLGVHPAWRGQGIGEALKWRQRELALEMGIRTVVWTYDPLEAANASLNIARLGGIVRTYGRDYYFAMEDALNRDIPSDRFTVEWHLESPRVLARISSNQPLDREQKLAAPLALASESGPQGMLQPGMLAIPEGAAARIEFTTHMQEIKRNNHELAVAWRMAVREACEEMFQRGYVVTDVLRQDDRIYYYVETGQI
jgi:predicted GNAT superfamily acetyltransferase